jgi:hypothetical protein
LDELRLAETEARIDAMLATGHHAELIPELEELVADQPFRERLRAQHMLALYRSGRQVDALESYQVARRALDEDLGLEPGPAIQQLQLAILRQDPALDASSPSIPGSVNAPRAPATTPGTVAPASEHPSARRKPLPVALVRLVVLLLVVASGALIQMASGRPGSVPSTRGTNGAAGAVRSPTPETSIPAIKPVELDLMDQLPTAVRSDCRPVSAADGGRGDEARLRCVLPLIAEADEVWFDRFSTPDSLNASFNDLRQESGASPGDCADSRLAVQTWEVRDVHEGQLLCYTADSTAWIVWTYEGDRILARVSRRGDDWMKLYLWWRETARFLRRH